MKLPDLLTLIERRPDLQALLGCLSFSRHTEEDYRELAQTQKRRRKVFSRWSQCVGKRGHETPEGARRVARRMGKPGLTTYHCIHCGKWHVGRAA